MLTEIVEIDGFELRVSQAQHVELTVGDLRQRLANVNTPAARAKLASVAAFANHQRVSVLTTDLPAETTSPATPVVEPETNPLPEATPAAEASGETTVRRRRS